MEFGFYLPGWAAQVGPMFELCSFIFLLATLTTVMHTSDNQNHSINLFMKYILMHIIFKQTALFMCPPQNSLWINIESS